MGACFSASRKVEDIRPEEKWDFISLNDFKSTSIFSGIAYGYLWLSLVISVAVYGVDTFTAVNLLAFNKWSSEIDPAIPLDISKWIFSICIILSWVNLGFEYLRALRVMRRGSVAESYLDSLAVRLQSIRLGSGRGWKRFLVFAELTKSKKGSEYVALFTYFSFQAWIRIIFCSGPRQVVNSLTLYSVFQAKLQPDSDDVGSSILQFFDNIAILAEDNHQQAVVLSGMIFTLVIWVVQALSLIFAAIAYLLFLWHWIPNHDAGLSGFCQRKINHRLTKIVSVKVNKALEEEERKRRKMDKKAAKNGEKPLGRQATLPQLFEAKDSDKLPEMPMLNRNDTMSTLPLYTSRPGTPSSQVPTVPSFELSNLDKKRPPPTRSGTMATDASYGSNAPLLGGAADMGYTRSPSPAMPLPMDNAFPPVQRTMTASTSTSSLRGPGFGPSSLRSPSTPGSMNSQSRMAPGAYPGSSTTSLPNVAPNRNMAPNGYAATSTTSLPASNMPGGPSAMDSYGRPLMGPGSNAPGRSTPMNGPNGDMAGRSMQYSGPVSRQPTLNEMPTGRASPAPTYTSGGRASPAPSGMGPRSPMNPMGPVQRAQTANGYMAYNPNGRSASANVPSPSYPQQPHRNMTEPIPARRYDQDSMGMPEIPRTGTPQSMRGGYPGGQGNAYPNEPRSPASQYDLESVVSYNGNNYNNNARGPPPPGSQGRYQRY